MARLNESNDGLQPGLRAHTAFRHFGDDADGTTDGIAGKIHSARVQGYYAGGLAYRDIAVDDNGYLQIGATLTVGDVEIGAVELKDGATDNRASISAGGQLLVTGTGGTFPVTGTFWQGTQPVSLATVPSHEVTNAGTFAVQAAATLAAETTKVIGTVNQGTSPWAVGDGAGSLTVDSPQLPAALAANGGLKVEGVAGGVAVPISAASLPLPTDAATQTTLAMVLADLDALYTDASNWYTGSSVDAIVNVRNLPSVQGQNTMANSVPVVLASDQSSTPVAATLAAETTKVIGTVNQPTGQGKTLLFGTIAQGAAGTTQLVAADGTKKIKVVSYAFTMSLAGTAKFSDTSDLTGAFVLAANGGIALAGAPSSHLFETAVNKALSIITTIGAATGHIAYFLE